MYLWILGPSYSVSLTAFRYLSMVHQLEKQRVSIEGEYCKNAGGGGALETTGGAVPYLEGTGPRCEEITIRYYTTA